MPDLQEAFVCRALAEAGRQGTPARLVNLRLQPPWHTEICTHRRNNVTGNVTVTVRADPSNVGATRFSSVGSTWLLVTFVPTLMSQMSRRTLSHQGLHAQALMPS
jgi:hypothetical protein